MHTFSFEKLIVWQEAVKLSIIIYHISEKFPKEEKYGLVPQIRRASISISSNLAEGLTRKTNKEKARFISFSFGSTMEVLNQLILAKELAFISEENYLATRKLIERIANLLNSLKKSLLN